MQLLVYSRTSEVDDILLGSLSFVAGGVLLPWAARNSGAESPKRFRFVKTLFLAIYLVWLFLFYWWPLNINLNPEMLLQRGEHFFQLPFLVLYAGSYSNASAEISRKVFLFAMLALLIAAMLDERRFHGLSRRTLLLASLGGSLLSGILIEVGQVAMPDRTADLTDIILYSVGAACGTFLGAYLRGATVRETHGAMRFQRPLPPRQ